MKKKKEFVRNTMEDFEKSTNLINALFRMPGLEETFQSWTTKMSTFLKETFCLGEEPVIEVYKRKKKFDIKSLLQKVGKSAFD